MDGATDNNVRVFAEIGDLLDWDALGHVRRGFGVDNRVDAFGNFFG